MHHQPILTNFFPAKAPSSRFDQSEWRYASLVLVLLLIGGATSWVVVEALFRHPALATAPEAFPLLAMTIMALTTGFLFLSGAFGIWAVRTTTEVEGRRRVGRFVEELGAIEDAILLLDGDGTISDMNEAARGYTTLLPPGATKLRELFPTLSSDDATLLLNASAPLELERVATVDEALRTLRFRSEPHGEFSLCWVSDITHSKQRDYQRLQQNRCQLIGRIAGSIAHDFNNILSVVSAHAALLNRPGDLSSMDTESLSTIQSESRRGAELARQLIDMGRSEPEACMTDRIGLHLDRAAQLLHSVLPPGWEIICTVEPGMSGITMGGGQLEQIVVNLGSMAAEAFSKPAKLVLWAAPLASRETAQADIRIGLTVVESHAPFCVPDPNHGEVVDDPGIIQSVIASLLDDVGGTFTTRRDAGDHRRYEFRVPARSQKLSNLPVQVEIPQSVRSMVGEWNLLLARPSGEGTAEVQEQLQAMGATVESVGDLVAALARVEASHPYQAILIDQYLLGGQANHLLKTILKLNPSIGLVVLGDMPLTADPELKQHIVFEPLSASTNVLVNALWRAQELALQRQKVA